MNAHIGTSIFFILIVIVMLIIILCGYINHINNVQNFWNLKISLLCLYIINVFLAMIALSFPQDERSRPTAKEWYNRGPWSGLIGLFWPLLVSGILLCLIFIFLHMALRFMVTNFIPTAEHCNNKNNNENNKPKIKISWQDKLLFWLLKKKGYASLVELQLFLQKEQKRLQLENRALEQKLQNLDRGQGIDINGKKIEL